MNASFADTVKAGLHTANEDRRQVLWKHLGVNILVDRVNRLTAKVLDLNAATSIPCNLPPPASADDIDQRIFHGSIFSGPEGMSPTPRLRLLATPPE